MTKRELGEILSSLRMCYSQRIDAAEWSRMVSEYYRRLNGYHADDLKKACDDAATAFPQWFPNVGNIAQLANKYAELRRQDWEARKRKEAEEREDREIRLEWSRLPIDTIQIEKEMGEARTCFELLEVVWPAVDKSSGSDGTRLTPNKTGDPRIRLLAKQWEAHPDKCEVCPRLPEMGTDQRFIWATTGEFPSPTDPAGNGAPEADDDLSFWMGL